MAARTRTGARRRRRPDPPRVPSARRTAATRRYIWLVLNRNRPWAAAGSGTSTTPGPPAARCPSLAHLAAGLQPRVAQNPAAIANRHVPAAGRDGPEGAVLPGFPRRTSRRCRRVSAPGRSRPSGDRAQPPGHHPDDRIQVRAADQHAEDAGLDPGSPHRRHWRSSGYSTPPAAQDSSSPLSTRQVSRPRLLPAGFRSGEPSSRRRIRSIHRGSRWPSGVGGSARDAVGAVLLIEGQVGYAYCSPVRAPLRARSTLVGPAITATGSPPPVRCRQ